MILWEKLLKSELGIRDGKDVGLGENEVDLLLDEMDEILDDDDDDEGGNKGLIQLDGAYDEVSPVKVEAPNSAGTNSFQFSANAPQSATTGGTSSSHGAPTNEFQQEDPSFDIAQYRAPIDEDAPQDILICQYSDILFKTDRSEYIMELVRGVLYLGERDYLFHHASCAASLERSEKLTTTTRIGAIISNMGGTARMQGKDQDLNLNMTDLTKRMQNAEYDPQKFGGHHIQIRRNQPRSTCKIFRTGTINVIGTSSERDARLAAIRAAAIVKSLGVPDATIKEFRITSIGAAYNYGNEIDLSVIKSFFPGDFVHVGEDKTAIDYEMKHPPVKLKIYQTGSIKITDAKAETDIDDCLDKLLPHLDNIVQATRQQEAMRIQRERQEAERKAFLQQQEFLARQQQIRQQQQQQQQQQPSNNAFGDPSWFSNKDIDF